ncbi:hypothetical protein QWI17_02205 [Gilvimarinus sp. SDUM040013]|uniref:Uncharacterized protein n=1 Tax=Gilvimarinus gilvus TaxID=3058038 RepID=A0ABU4RZ86_9GAMM|nr:hypothetical protein [Gilvimarinus sp. SDUM040013]MDO3384644.1 hypothetical protein [Gilvimarinus sp. SDUM040013]MDX6850230.1 hypothetical protein [Gilvimarinus sp. SDUM040013]
MASLITLIAIAIVAFVFLKRLGIIQTPAQREHLIATYRFPPRLHKKVLDTYPHLSDDQANKVIDGLREYFQLCNTAGRRSVAMPSQAVDVAWHEFILFTQMYSYFCKKALGRFLHHTPAEAMQTPTQAQAGIKTAWKVSCRREGISRNNPERLPLLFAMDAELNIEDGFHYSLNCEQNGSGYCASHIGCGSGGCSGGCGSGSGNDGGSSCGSGCGGGD